MRIARVDWLCDAKCLADSLARGLFLWSIVRASKNKDTKGPQMARLFILSASQQRIAILALLSFAAMC